MPPSAAPLSLIALQIVRDIVAPLSKTGVALGSVLVLTQTLGDFFVVHVLSGGKSGGVVTGIANQLNAFEYPPAAASSVVLLVVVIALVLGLGGNSPKTPLARPSTSTSSSPRATQSSTPTASATPTARPPTQDGVGGDRRLVGRRPLIAGAPC